MGKIIPIIRERTHYLVDVQKMITEGELDYYFMQPNIDSEEIVWKKDTKEQSIMHLKKAHDVLSTVPEHLFNKETTKDILWSYAEQVGKGNLLWPVRFCLSGRDTSPDPFTLLEVLGKKTSLDRISHAVDILSI